MLKFINVSKTFNKSTINEKKALDNISVNIEDGEFVTIIGQNGSGKSTFMNLISGVHESDSGQILIDDIDVTFVNEHKRAKYLGRVFQDTLDGTASNMLIEENLALALRRGKRRGLSWGISQKEREMYKEELSKFGLGLENRLQEKVGLMSGGQRQAIALLMATFASPKLLLLDEHTAALDPKTAKAVLEITDQVVREKNITTLMITHNMKDALTYGDRLLMFKDGHIIFDCKGEEKKKLTVVDLLNKFEE